MSNGMSATAAPPVAGAWAWPGRMFYELLLALHWAIVRPLRKRSRRPMPKGQRRLLLTGTFFSENWILNHLKPLASSSRCDRVILVTTFPLPPIANVDAVRPPAWMVRLLGAVPARLMTFMLTAVRERPDAVGGFHILPNALVALLAARLIGSRSLYFCGGGPTELEGGGYYSGSKSAAFLKAPDAGLEKRLLRAVSEFDLVITMGTSARNFFIDRGVASRIEIIPGGIDASFLGAYPRSEAFDLILIARLDPIKRIDLFLQTVRALSAQRPEITAVIVGGGDLDATLRQFALEIGVDDRVVFAGYQKDVGVWLARAKVFVLTSESEGLSLALMEAMTAGLPCVVTNVGELGQLVEDGATGFLVDDHTVDALARPIEALLRDSTLRARFGEAGRKAATRLTVAETAKRWDDVLSTL